VNTYLANVKNSIESHYLNSLARDITLSIQELKSFAVDILNKKGTGDLKDEDGVEKDFYYYFDLFISARGKSGQYSKRIIQYYETVKSHLLTFDTYRRKKTEFDEVDSDYLQEFVQYLAEKKKHTNNTLVGNITKLKTFLNYAIKEGFTDNAKFLSYKNVKEQDAQSIALSEQELTMLEDHRYKAKHLANVRDLFLIMVYTGIRYSDLANLKKENIFLEEGVIKLNIKKTHDTIYIPIHSKLKPLVEKFINNEIKVISNQKLNLYLKVVCRQAGIDQEVQRVWYHNKNRKQENKKKYELVTTHTGRRTFITISLKRKALPEEVMKISGHKNRQAFQKYVRISQEEAVLKIKSIWEE
jgi:site-specific recombinase XerD